jgi:lipopolysaccharide transport system ATP-binding protein
MSNIALQVENLAKKYEIALGKQRHDTLRDQISEAVRSMFRSNGRSRGGKETFWALKDVSFEIKKGELVGVIGRNGAGKSTLLKILSRITVPTEGKADLYGRVASLLEVGTGFHGELSGRENVYLNGAILGMKKAEIDRKFDEIVAFSEVEKFIDTPVKRYSSGMFVRLAFAVAAHLEPEILIVDEVLAVGDARFQKKCLSKMEEVGYQGRTVLFVSHNMQSITRLCPRVILLDGGKILQDGPSHEAVSAYLDSGIAASAAREWPDPEQAPGGEVARLRAVRVRSEDGQIAELTDIRRAVRVEMEYDVLQPGHVLLAYYDFYNEEGLDVFSTMDLDPAWRGRPRPQGRWISTVLIPGNLLAEGTLFVGPGLLSLNTLVAQFQERDVVAFQVVDSHDGDSARGDWAGKVDGVMRPLLNWSTQFDPKESQPGAISIASTRNRSKLIRQ